MLPVTDHGRSRLRSGATVQRNGQLRLYWRQLKNKVTGFFNQTFHQLIMAKKARSRRYNQLSPAEKKLLKIKWLRLAALIFFGLVIAGILGFFLLFAYFSRDLPKPGQVVRREGFSSRIYDRNGNLLYDLYQEERRNPIKIADVPQYLKDATVAIEDKDFYRHQGYDWLTVLRIPYNYLFRGGRVVGGSTLTQQLVKNALLSNERTVARKFKELVLAVQIERNFTKDEILEMYLNESPYGGTAWGVGTAASVYFNKPVQDLTLVESVFLAGLPQSPSAYSPYFGRTNDEGEPLWRLRSRAVLAAMKENGYITDLAYEDTLNQLGSLEFQRTVTEIKAPHFVFYLRQQLTEMFGEELLTTGGLTITTTLDLPLQEAAQEIVTSEVDSVARYNISNGAAMAMDPQNGEILAMIGSKDYFNTEIGGQYNVAVDGLRQPGSSIKPITYLALFQMGYNPATMLMDVETTFVRNEREEPYTPRNYDGIFRGPVSVRQALGSSLNIPAVKTLAMVGIKNWLSLAYSMGLGTLEPTDANMKKFGLSATLGGADVHMIDLISAYSSFANGGRKVEPVAILKVVDKDGRTLYEHKPVEGPQVMDPGEAFLINDILSDNNARLLAFGANSVLNTGRPIAVKTGTTNNMKDNWTIGWSQDVIVVSWVGNNDGKEMSYVASGITGASPIWRKIFDRALNLGYTAPDWVVPDDVERLELDAISGYRAHDGFPTKWDYVIKGTLSNMPDPIHRKVQVCRDDNSRMATEAKIAVGDYDEREFIFLREEDPFSEDGRNRWQEAINAWLTGQQDGRYRTPSGYCGEEGDVSMNLEHPNDRTTYDSQDIEFEGRAGSAEGIEKIELYANDKVVEIIEGKLTFKESVHLESGRYEIYAKAYARNGKTATTGKIRIGTGGTNWEAPQPTTPPPTTSPPTTPPPTTPPPTAPPPTPTISPT